MYLCRTLTFNSPNIEQKLSVYYLCNCNNVIKVVKKELDTVISIGQSV